MAQFTNEEFKVVTATAIKLNRVIHSEIITPALKADEHRVAHSGGMAMSALAIATASTIIGCDWKDLDGVLETMVNHVRFHHRQIKEGMSKVIHAKSAEEAFDILRERSKK